MSTALRAVDEIASVSALGEHVARKMGIPVFAMPKEAVSTGTVQSVIIAALCDAVS